MFVVGWFAAFLYLMMYTGALTLARSKPKKRAEAHRVFRLVAALAVGSVGPIVFATLPMSLGLITA